MEIGKAQQFCNLDSLLWALSSKFLSFCSDNFKFVTFKKKKNIAGFGAANTMHFSFPTIAAVSIRKQ
jgi:hypothetical protein